MQNLQITQDSFVMVQKSYLQNFKQTIKQLQGLLNIRLRTECPNSMEILNELNQKLLNFQQLQDNLEQIYQSFQQKRQNSEQMEKKAQKYDKLVVKLEEIEQNFQENHQKLIQEMTEQRQSIKEFKQKELEHMENMEFLQLQVQEQKLKAESHLNEIELKDAEINRLKIEKESSKRQQSNLQSLLKQINEEKDFKNQKNQKDNMDEKLTQVRSEIAKVEESYQDKISQKDIRIESLERELKLVQSELELNSEFTFLQSSVASNSASKLHNKFANFANNSHSRSKSIDKIKLFDSSTKNHQHKVEGKKNKHYNSNISPIKKASYSSNNSGNKNNIKFSSSVYSSNSKSSKLYDSGKVLSDFPSSASPSKLSSSQKH